MVSIMIIALSKTCNAVSHRGQRTHSTIDFSNPLFDPIHGCYVEPSCFKDKCGVELNEYSLAAFNNLKHEHVNINWNQVEAENQKMLDKELNLFESGESSAYSNSMFDDEAELSSIMARQAVRCPNRGHHVGCTNGGDSTCRRYHDDAYCLYITLTGQDQYGQPVTQRIGRCYLDTYNPRTGVMRHNNRF